MTDKITRRAAAKLRTRDKAVRAAQEAFTSADYHTVTIRALAKAMGMSPGAIFANFEGKAELFSAAMGFAPPLDGPLSRAAPMLREALEQAIDGLARNSDAWIKAKAALELAETPLDGEAWARHLASIRRDEPHTLAARQSAASVPSDAAGAQ